MIIIIFAAPATAATAAATAAVVDALLLQLIPAAFADQSLREIASPLHGEIKFIEMNHAGALVDLTHMVRIPP